MGLPRGYSIAIIFFLSLASTALAASPNATLEIYEADVKSNSISLRLRPIPPEHSDIDEYTVSVIINNTSEDRKQMYKVSGGLECTLWEDSVCFKKYYLPQSIKLSNLRDTTYHHIQIRGDKDGETKNTWRTQFMTKFYKQAPSAPRNFTWNDNGRGMVSLTWLHPLLPYAKIERFEIQIQRKDTHLQPLSSRPTSTENVAIAEEKREYTHMLSLLTATRYEIQIVSVNPIYGEPETIDFWTRSKIIFTPPAKLEVKQNGTKIELGIPGVVNATDKTCVQTIMKGTFTCAGKNTEKEWRALEVPVVKDSVPINQTIDANNTGPDCFLNHGTNYEIKVEIIDGWSNDTRPFLPANLITFSADDSSGQIMPEVKSLDWGLLGIAAVVITIICLAVLFFVYRRNRRRAFQKTSKKKQNFNYDP